MTTGFNGRVKGKVGRVICCIERGEWDGKTYPILSVKAGIIDGEILKPDVWYTVKNGEWVLLDD